MSLAEFGFVSLIPGGMSARHEWKEQQKYHTSNKTRQQQEQEAAEFEKRQQEATKAAKAKAAEEERLAEEERKRKLEEEAANNKPWWHKYGDLKMGETTPPPEEEDLDGNLVANDNFPKVFSMTSNTYVNAGKESFKKERDGKQAETPLNEEGGEPLGNLGKEVPEDLLKTAKEASESNSRPASEVKVVPEQAQSSEANSVPSTIGSPMAEAQLKLFGEDSSKLMSDNPNILGPDAGLESSSAEAEDSKLIKTVIEPFGSDNSLISQLDDPTGSPDMVPTLQEKDQTIPIKSIDENNTSKGLEEAPSVGKASQDSYTSDEASTSSRSEAKRDLGKISEKLVNKSKIRKLKAKKTAAKMVKVAAQVSHVSKGPDASSPTSEETATTLDENGTGAENVGDPKDTLIIQDETIASQANAQQQQQLPRIPPEQTRNNSRKRHLEASLENISEAGHMPNEQQQQHQQSPGDTTGGQITLDRLPSFIFGKAPLAIFSLVICTITVLLVMLI